MTSVLLVKTSSLGDVVHNLPVVADLKAALGAVTIDWVVERPFAAIPALHTGVRNVICCDIRRWRRSWKDADTREEWRCFVKQLQASIYDAVIDTQGLLKSAVIARLARGRRYGLDWRSSREPLRLFYDRVFHVPRSLHAVVRNRRLCGLALGYEPQPVLEYGLNLASADATWQFAGGFVVFLHATSHPSKLWPEQRWIELGGRYAAAGVRVVLPWGNDTERQRASRLAVAIPAAIVPERMSLDAVARMIGCAAAVIGVDTGLTHLAAALNRPVVGIYGVTSPATTGVFAHGRTWNAGSSDGFPNVDEVAAGLARMNVAPGDLSVDRNP